MFICTKCGSEKIKPKINHERLYEDETDQLSMECKNCGSVGKVISLDERFSDLIQKLSLSDRVRIISFFKNNELAINEYLKALKTA